MFWRKVQGVGLQAGYIQNAELAICIRLLPALAFAPDEVPQLFTPVVEQLPIPEGRDLLRKYLHRTWFTRGVLRPLCFTSTCGIIT